VQCAASGLEYRPSTPGTLFAQRRNLVSAPFWRMLVDIFRLQRSAGDFTDMAPDLTLGEYLDRNGYSRFFREKFLVPLYAALWSADPQTFESFPARTFALFLGNHGFLRVYGQPQWLVVKGGSSRYLGALTTGWEDLIRLNSPVRVLRRTAGGVEVVPEGGEAEPFDQAVVAVHSDQALAMLEQPTDDERRLLGAIPYQENSVVLHTDQRMLPRRHKVRASWNYHLPDVPGKQASVTYSMNRLQGLDAPVEFCVTLNRDEEIDPESVLGRFSYAHPVFTTAGIAAQRQHREISSAGGIHYCGAYWGFGFHEDGVNSALDVCRQLGERL
jgi:predicted NAD/FAD-binding protein